MIQTATHDSTQLLWQILLCVAIVIVKIHAETGPHFPEFVSNYENSFPRSIYFGQEQEMLEQKIIICY